MSYPSMEQYSGAVQNPQLAFTDPVLRQGKVATNGFGLPIALGGGFALTYTFTSGTRKFAVRCFHKQASGLEDRYARISSALASLGSSNFVGFEYQPSGIRVQGNPYPIVRMDWVAGETLGIWLENHYGDRAAVTNLVTAFRGLERFLRDSGLAHGDLQNGNVLIQGGSLKLIDYDGLYVPGLPVGQGNEVGHKHFQHPKRRGSDFGPDMDRFSFIAVDLSLRALAEQPSLFQKHSNGDNILFSAGDYLNPSSSAVFGDVRSIPSLAGDVENFARICDAPFKAIPSLEDFLNGRNIPGAVVAFPMAGQRPAARSQYVGAYEVVDARDYAAALEGVGDRVELIGQIVEVKEDKTRHGRPYAFINFGPWKGNIVKLSVWSDGLKKLATKPDQSWVGRWISVIGLLEPPYTNAKYGYSHISITIEEANQYRFIDETEALRRLGSTNVISKPAQQTGSKNRAILDGLAPARASKPVGRSAATPISPSGNSRPTTAPTPRVQPTGSRSAGSTAAAASARAGAAGSHSPGPPPTNAATGGTQPPRPVVSGSQPSPSKTANQLLLERLQKQNHPAVTPAASSSVPSSAGSIRPSWPAGKSQPRLKPTSSQPAFFGSTRRRTYQPRRKIPGWVQAIGWLLAFLFLAHLGRGI